MTQPARLPFKDHFSDVAAGYAAHRPAYPLALAQFLAEKALRRDVAWDCGCGSGQLSLLLADWFDRVIATDASGEQIANATLHPRIEYRQGSAEAAGLPDALVDLVVAAQAAHWFDLPAFYSEVRRVGRAGAIIALVTYGLTAIDPDIDRVVDHFYSVVVGKYWPPERSHVEDGYRSLEFPFNELEAPRLEMTAHWTLEQFLGYVDTWSAVCAMKKTEGDSAVEKFRGDLARVWGNAASIRIIRWPLSLRIGRT